MTLITRRNALKLGLAGGALLAGSSMAMAQLRIVVEGANKVKKHQRPNPMKGMTGGIIDKEMPLHVSNVGLFNPATKKADRVGIKALEDGRRVRYFKSNGEVIDV